MELDVNLLALQSQRFNGIAHLSHLIRCLRHFNAVLALKAPPLVLRADWPPGDG